MWVVPRGCRTAAAGPVIYAGLPDESGHAVYVDVRDEASSALRDICKPYHLYTTTSINDPV